MSHAPAPGADDPLSLTGVVPPTLTIFDDEEAVDLERTAAHARYVVDRGASGVFPLGTNGEFAMLDAAERDGVVEAVVDEVGGEVPVIAGVGAPSTRRAVRRAEAAMAAGADGLVCVTPYYYAADDAGLVEHYRRLTGAVDLPVYVYHIPQRAGVELALDALDEIAQLDGIAGLMDTSKDVPWLAQAIARNPDLTFLSGSDALQFAGLEVGCAGGVSGVANAFPELVADLHAAYAEGDEARAEDLQRTMFEVRQAIKRGPPMGGVKTALSLRGFEAGPLRSPLRRPDAETTAAIERDLEATGLL